MDSRRRRWRVVGGALAVVAIFVVAPPTGIAMAGFGVALVAIGTGLG